MGQKITDAKKGFIHVYIPKLWPMKKTPQIYGIYKNVLNPSPSLLQHLLHQGKFLFCPTKTVWSLTGFLQRVMKCRPNQSSINCPGAAPTASPTIVKV